MVANKNNSFEVVWKLNHTYFNYRAGSFMLTGYHKTITTMTKANLLFTINFGYNPFGWSNFITWFLMVGIFFMSDRKNTFMIMFIGGFFLLFINLYIGFNTAMSVAAGGAIPIVMIFFGIMMLIRDRARFTDDR